MCMYVFMCVFMCGNIAKWIRYHLVGSSVICLDMSSTALAKAYSHIIPVACSGVFGSLGFVAPL